MIVWKSIIAALSVALVGSIGAQALAWNLGAKKVNALRFEADGDIYFTLFENEARSEEFACRERTYWFKINACGVGDYQCIAAANRMAGMLLTAKTTGRMVHVQRSGCEVSEVAMKP